VEFDSKRPGTLLIGIASCTWNPFDPKYEAAGADVLLGPTGPDGHHPKAPIETIKTYSADRLPKSPHALLPLLRKSGVAAGSWTLEIRVWGCVPHTTDCVYHWLTFAHAVKPVALPSPSAAAADVAASPGASAAPGAGVNQPAAPSGALPAPAVPAAAVAPAPAQLGSGQQALGSAADTSRPATAVLVLGAAAVLVAFLVTRRRLFARR
jgi:hypothetical protein